VSIDGRIYRYDESRWRTYAAVASGTTPHGPIFDDERPDAVFLRPGHDDRLIDNMKADRAWSTNYHDANCHIFLRAGIPPADSPTTQ
jgi:hypothetical protein